MRALPFLLVLAACGGPAETSGGDPSNLEAPPQETAMDYPQARKGDTVDTYFGVQVADPYRWLEDPDSDETRAWIDAENTITRAWLDGEPKRTEIHDRLSKLWNYERFGTPHKRGDRYFYTHNTGVQDQSVLYTAPSLDADKQLLLDPNTLSEDGTVSLAGWVPSEDGKLLAYGLSDGGSDWRTWKVRNVETGTDLEDEVEWVKFSEVSWTHDGQGFFYGRYPVGGDDKLEAANYDYKLYYHRLGTPQADDELIYERPDEPEWGFGNKVTEDGETLVIHVWQGTEEKNRIYLKSLKDPKAPVVKLLDDFDAYYYFLGNEGTTHWYQTNLDAPKGKVIQIDTTNPGRDNWKTLVPEAAETLQSTSFVGGKLIMEYLKDARSVVKVFAKDGTAEGEVELPGIGSAGGFGGKQDSTETFYSFTGYTTPNTIYRYDIATGTSELYKQPEVDFDPSAYETTQVFYPSKDGTKIPMFITRKKGTEQNGENKTLLYGYGGFNISITPSFSVSNLVWLEQGGVYAVANLRGGGEYGEEWHQAGTKLNKQNVFDDFIAAGEYLVAQKWTSPEHMGISGRSNGGLLVGATVLQRPDLFGAAMPGVGVMDMLRYHKFTIGWAWASDYGTSEDNQEMFEYLRAYSPVHNAEPAEYPPTMVITADHDDRVVPAHSFKFAAALQEAQQGTEPILIRIETRAGHGAGTPISMQIDQKADELAFLVRALR